MLDLNNVCAYYNKLKVLHDITIQIREGEKVGIFGHNGAGKTTILKSCIGDIDHIEGSITVEDERILPGKIDRNVRRGIGFVPQGNNVFKSLTVEKNLQISGLRHESDLKEEIFELFPILKERHRQQADSLSGGQQQMLALGMALMTHPKVLLLDEPTTGLAPIIVRDVFENISKVNKATGATLVIVEQNIQTALQYVDRAIVIKSGRKIFDGTNTELLDDDDLWRLF
ncbi:ABC transporter ATP-binding protein [Castellaniella sp.]|uniref:ABC transporter ATP-binding protein n=1 Tax=Castellaniella sp. TaxID=1955812 RepID=UPI003566B9BF